MGEAIPLVDYLVLGNDPHLEANECVACGARFFDRRNACASCGAINSDGSGFKRVELPATGELTAFTIVSFAAPGIEVPFVAGVVKCGGTSVRANIVNVSPDPEHVATGMQVSLTTFGIGEDSEGTEAIGFGYEPADEELRITDDAIEKAEANS